DATDGPRALGLAPVMSAVGELPLLTVVNASGYELGVHALDLGVRPDDRLLDAGLAALAHVGDATVEALAAAMGVNKAPLYRYFGNRAGLYRALADRWVSRALANNRRVTSVGSVPEAVEAGFLAYLRLLAHDRDTYLALSRLGHIADPSGDQHVMDYVETAGAALTRLLGAVVLDGDGTVERLRTWGQAVAAMIHHVGDRWVREPWASPEEVARSLARLVVPSLEADRPLGP
ncbi:MAG TPA: TetR/AcrR family transcriptional regulator, partial [Acidimicrobiales bacterium]